MPSINPRTLWEAKQHTLAKIEIVRRYLYLWFSILGANPANKRLVYIDGFSGPGGYTNSEHSSPLAALQSAKAAIERPGAKLNNVEFSFLFIEKKREFVENLCKVVSANSWPSQLKWHAEQGSFEEKVGGILRDLQRKGQSLAPTFAFIDPFGATGLPFSVVAEILSHRKCEVLLNLDSDGIGRLITAQQFEKNQKNLDSLFGDQSWKQLDPSAPMARLSASVLALYKKRLRSLRQVRYVFAFAMNSREGQLNYHLVFGSQHPLGLEKMKEAMKAVDKSGSYSFSDDTVGQELLFDFNAPADWATKMQLALGGSPRPYSEFHDYALNETPFINPKAMFKHLKDIGKLRIQWRGQPAKTGFPEEKIASILIVK
ncbi:MAG TPA: three-Cys-motif partner protein TcmP [Candidatus Udaeobacter sp.]